MGGIGGEAGPGQWLPGRREDHHRGDGHNGTGKISLQRQSIAMKPTIFLNKRTAWFRSITLAVIIGKALLANLVHGVDDPLQEPATIEINAYSYKASPTL